MMSENEEQKRGQDDKCLVLFFAYGKIGERNRRAKRDGEMMDKQRQSITVSINGQPQPFTVERQVEEPPHSRSIASRNRGQ